MYPLQPWSSRLKLAVLVGYGHVLLVTPFVSSIYIYIPGTQMTSIVEGHPPPKKKKKWPFPIKTRVIWVRGIYIPPNRASDL